MTAEALPCNIFTKRKKELAENHKSISAGSIPRTNIQNTTETILQLVVSILNETDTLGKQTS